MVFLGVGCPCGLINFIWKSHINKESAKSLHRSGKQETVYSGHIDAVRKLCVLLDQTFMSCSNDGTVRHWDVSGACLRTLQLGSNFLYSMCALLEGMLSMSVIPVWFHDCFNRDCVNKLINQFWYVISVYSIICPSRPLWMK